MPRKQARDSIQKSCSPTLYVFLACIFYAIPTNVNIRSPLRITSYDEKNNFYSRAFSTILFGITGVVMSNYTQDTAAQQKPRIERGACQKTLRGFLTRPHPAPPQIARRGFALETICHVDHRH